MVLVIVGFLIIFPIKGTKTSVRTHTNTHAHTRTTVMCLAYILEFNFRLFLFEIIGCHFLQKILNQH